MEPTILVTGASGYIGSHLISHIVSLQPNRDILVCDLASGEDFGLIKDAKFDIVIHLAAHASVTESLKDPDECLANNAFKLVSFLRNNEIGKLVFTSTGGAIYGDKHFAKEEDASWNGCISPYGQSKYLAEQIIRRMHPNHAILRLGNVYGGKDTERKELAAHAHFMADDPIVVYGGKQARDFVHVDVVCEALLRATRFDLVGTFNLGSGEETQVSDVAEKFSRARNVPVVYQPARHGEIEYVSLDVTKARKAGLL